MSMIPPPQYAAVLSSQPLLPEIGTAPSIPDLGKLGSIPNLNIPNLPSSIPLPSLPTIGIPNIPGIPSLPNPLDWTALSTPSLTDLLIVIGMLAAPPLLALGWPTDSAGQNACLASATTALKSSTINIQVYPIPTNIDIGSNKARVQSPDENLNNYKTLSKLDFEGRNRLQQKALMSLYLGKRLSDDEFDGYLKDYNSKLTSIYTTYAKRY
jgi:hypothetical protein